MNARYVDELNAAAGRTGVSVATLARLVNAEAAKNAQGEWQADSKNASGAVGLTQFMPKTWRAMAETRGSALNAYAQEHDYLDPKGKVKSAKLGDLLALRTDGALSIQTAADYASANLKQLRASGALPSNATDQQAARAIYLAHHDGVAGAIDLVNGEHASLVGKRLDRVFEQNVPRGRQQSYLDRAQGSKRDAYALWISDYLNKAMGKSA